MKTMLTRAVIALAFTLSYSVGMTADPVAVVMETDLGKIQLEIYEDAAPITAGNFLKLVDGGHYDGGSFYRVVRLDNQSQNKVKIEVIQGGRGMDMPNTPFEPIAHETTEDTGIRHTDGVVSMGRLAPGTATSEFFICIGDQPELDFGGQRNPDGMGFAAFGKVTSGMAVVRKIQQARTDTSEAQAREYTSGQMVLEPIAIHSVARLDN